jgi:hypothetical protein
MFTANGAALDCEVAQAAALSPAVREQLCADACAHTFALSGAGALDSLRCLFSGCGVYAEGLLGRQLCNPVLELMCEGTWADRLDISSMELSALSVEALDAVLARASFSVASEDELLERLLSLGGDYHPLLRRVELRFLSAAGLEVLVEHMEAPGEWVWRGIADRLSAPPPPPAPVLDSVILSNCPAIFAEFRRKRFALLWRGGRDGFGARDFHGRCDGHANTLTVILDTDGNVFGGFTPVEWESRVWNGKGGDENNCLKADASLKSFIFTLKNPHNVPARRFALKAEKKEEAICCYFSCGPHFWDITVSDNCNANTNSHTGNFGWHYTNDTGLGGPVFHSTFFTGSPNFKVKEIEVFEITD